MADSYFADTERFPYDTIDGETVLIDSNTGRLFLFTGTGPLLWHRLLGGASVEDVVVDAIARYGESAGDPTREFLEKLVEAEMLRPGVAASVPSTAADVVSWPATFEIPVMERYEEMSDIINMDPIHDVDQAKGWPRRVEG